MRRRKWYTVKGWGCEVGDPVTTAIVVGAGSALYGARESRKARQEARSAADQEKERAKAAEAERERIRKEAEFKKGSAVRRAVSANRLRDTQVYDRGGSIATSPLGVVGNQGTGGKTLLGS